ncbi:hypothetical protein GIB67_019591 [Kingdonia uniflora]|uniref:Uncharacterized protein n=1 Tax=Kingdonia uniflora TaxID=39325 RepID=A0A7J7N0C9_9MAGN|nr:hypothetical protein GIB67_019591 [Kingdonia uniflora]
MYTKKKPTPKGGGRSLQIPMDEDGERVDIKQLMKNIELLGTSNMSWKERKELENRKVVSLGGKVKVLCSSRFMLQAVKKHRIPLSVARVTMKKRKERDQKNLQEGMLLGRFGGGMFASSSTGKAPEKRRAEDRVLKSTEGHFKNGILNVKSLMRSTSSSDNFGSRSSGTLFSGEGKKKAGGGKKGKGGKKKGGKRKGGKKRR